MCKQYDTAYHCSKCLVPICRPGSICRTIGGGDLGPRTCWEDHTRYHVQLPLGHGKFWRGSW